MNTARKGTQAELATAEWLGDDWLVGSRRHIGGAGDLLAVHWSGRTRLIEVKATKNGPYAGFPPKDRWELLRVAVDHGAEAELAWWAPRAKEPTIIPAADWPSPR